MIEAGRRKILHAWMMEKIADAEVTPAAWERATYAMLMDLYRMLGDIRREVLHERETSEEPPP